MDEEYETKKNIILNELSDESLDELYFNYCNCTQTNYHFINDNYCRKKVFILGRLSFADGQGRRENDILSCFKNSYLNELLRKQNEKIIQNEKINEQGDKITENINNLNKTDKKLDKQHKYIESIEGDIVEMEVEIHFIKDKVISISEELTKNLEEHSLKLNEKLEEHNVNLTKKLEEQEIKIYERLQEKLKKKEKIIEKLTTKIFEHQDLYEKMIEKKLERQDKKNTILILILCIMVKSSYFN